jgi:hypothetical protein
MQSNLSLLKLGDSGNRAPAELLYDSDLSGYGGKILINEELKCQRDNEESDQNFGPF